MLAASAGSLPQHLAAASFTAHTHTHTHIYDAYKHMTTNTLKRLSILWHKRRQLVFGAVCFALASKFLAASTHRHAHAHTWVLRPNEISRVQTMKCKQITLWNFSNNSRKTRRFMGVKWKYYHKLRWEPEVCSTRVGAAFRCPNCMFIAWFLDNLPQQFKLHEILEDLDFSNCIYQNTYIKRM